ncbi:hypothetical protein DCAR_0208397 [Daucus carota subsp. sativus]|uniref:HTH myb-type domain-containing protein n=1 Tax=Daucus carota subsp. sativus TaxID=79200 RepID=A0AAF1AR02_DAUCS|nr:hypothetical protein DCAR_0208397 [Daucus carota subsp. sativus]
MLQKRLNIVFNGHEVPPVPRAARSPRRRLPCRKKIGDHQMCAFDLLATVAGKLLEGESTPSATELLIGEDESSLGKDFLKTEKVAEENPEQVNPSHKEDRGRILFVSDTNPQAPEERHDIKGVPNVQNDACSAFASAVTTRDGPEMFGSASKLVNDESRIKYGNLSKVDVGQYHSATSLYSLDVKSKNCMKIEPQMIGKDPSSAGDVICLEDLIVQNVKPPVQDKSDNIDQPAVKPSVLHRSSQKALFRDQTSCGFFPGCRNNVNLVVRDDDENSSWCTPPRKINKVFWPPARNGDRRIKRLLASRYWKATLKSSKRDCYITGLDTRYAYHNRVKDYKRQRSLRDHPIKKRKLYDHTFTTNAYERVNKNNASFSSGKSYGGNASSVATMHEATGTSSFAASPQKCAQTNDSHVKLKIKSFRVPELFFEIPETATVGSLKRTVMETVTSILGGGLCVGVLVKGKKIRDDNKTLVQTGIYNDDRADALGFTLEPLSSQVPSAQCLEDHTFIPPEECPHASTIVKQGDSDVLPEVCATKIFNCLESDHDSAPSPPDMSRDKCQIDSRDLIASPQISAEVLSAVPIQSSKKLDIGQRRTRRPFSVSEVEALVHAVERLGTGRWRDVKMRAFDNAKHRTYVDLKDKWKTLVHTARISPQQRRGEPVPQELLDRVMAAHAFWSQQQTKQHSEASLLF